MALTDKQKEAQKRHYQKKKAHGKLRTDEVREREREYNRRYRAAHPEVFKAQRDRMDKEARREKNTEWQQANKARCRLYQNTWRVGKAAFDGAKSRAKQKGIPFDITREYVNGLIPTHCPVLGIELQTGKENKDANISIDRIVPELGYIVGNIIIVSFMANRLRSNATVEQLFKVATFYDTLRQQLNVDI